MTLDRKYQIFISSTFQDLKDERRAVMEEILNLGHIPVGMELFQAGDDSQWNYIKRRIADCDYYIIIVAERYGSVGRDMKSYTQLEYEYATELGIPAISFLLSAEARQKWPQSNIEFDRRKEVNALRDLCQQKLVRFWNSLDDLRARVVTSLVEVFRENPRGGWVRADAMASSEALNEIALLSNERRDLQSKLAQALEQNSNGNTKELRDAEDELRQLTISEYVETMIEAPLIDGDLVDLLIFLSRDLSISSSVYVLNNSFEKHIGADGYGVNLQPALAEFSLMGVIEAKAITRHSSLGGSSTYNEYFLTEFGKKLVRYAERGMSETTEKI